MWTLPTRSRPQNCLRLITAWKQTESSTPVYVRLDDDDPELDALKNLPWPEEFEIHVGPRIGVSQSIEEVFQTYPNEPWYGFLADDLLPQTVHWDQQLIKQAGSFNIAYPNDGGKDTTLPTHPCMGGDLIRAIGWLGFPPCQHYFTDTVFQYIGNALQNIYRLDDVIVEHLHYSLDKSEKDQTYVESGEKWKSDKREYRDWVEQHGKLLIEKLQKDIYNSK